MQFKQKILTNTCYCLCHEKDNRHKNDIMSAGPRAEKFDIVSSDHGRTQRSNFLSCSGKFCAKKHNCQFILKFHIFTNSNMENLIVMFIFSVFDWKYLFCALFLFSTEKPNIRRICSKKLKNSMMMFTFSVLDRQQLFWAQLVQKIRIVSLNWNLVPRQI